MNIEEFDKHMQKTLDAYNMFMSRKPTASRVHNVTAYINSFNAFAIGFADIIICLSDD